MRKSFSNVKRVVVAASLLIACVVVSSPQSGRKAEVVKPTPPQEPSVPSDRDSSESPHVTKESEVYRCTSDSFVRLSDLPDEGEVFTTKTVDVKAYIDRKPKAGYTKEARRAGVQGNVILRMSLLSTGEIGTIRVLRGLPAGLTESALRAACQLRFRPAIKDKKEVSQYIQIEYTFRLTDR